MTGKFSASSATNTGADAVITVPSDQQWRVKSVEVDLNTSAQVANRYLGVYGIVNGLGICDVPSSYVQTAGAHPYYTFAPGIVTDAAIVDGDIRVGFPEICLGPGDTIGTTASGIQSGDVVNIRVNYEAFIA